MLKCTKHSKSYTNTLSYKTFEVIYIVLGACKHGKVTIIRKITKKMIGFLVSGGYIVRFKLQFNIILFRKEIHN